MRTTTRRSEEGERITTTVSLDKVTYKRLQHLAVDQDTSVRELIRKGVALLLRKEGTPR